MINMPNIDISKEAYDNLVILLSDHKEYTHVKFCYANSSCCKASKIDIYLDEANENDIITSFNNLKIIIDDEVLKNIKNINLIYKDNSFFIKTELINTKPKSCCSSSNGKKSCESCGGCKNS